MAKVKITLKKSLIGSKPNQKVTAASLGLKKIGDCIVHEDGAVLSGKLAVISHLVQVEDAEYAPQYYRKKIRRKSNEAP